MQEKKYVLIWENTLYILLSERKCITDYHGIFFKRICRYLLTRFV